MFDSGVTNTIEILTMQYPELKELELSFNENFSACKSGKTHAHSNTISLAFIKQTANAVPMRKLEAIATKVNTQLYSMVIHSSLFFEQYHQISKECKLSLSNADASDMWDVIYNSIVSNKYTDSSLDDTIPNCVSNFNVQGVLRCYDLPPANEAQIESIRESVLQMLNAAPY